MTAKLIAGSLTKISTFCPQDMQKRSSQREIKKRTNPPKVETIFMAGKNLFLHIEGGVMTIDPVCGMEVDEESTEFQTTYGGKDFYFCSDECETKFDGDPAQYAAASAA